MTAWWPGYEPMLDVLRDAGGYHGGDESRGQIDPVATGCAFADEVLLPAIREYGQLDQVSLMVIPGASTEPDS